MADSDKINQIETKNINKVSGVLGKNINRMGNTIVKFDIVPQGLIVFYNDTIMPDGWSQFTLANNKAIVGAGSSYSVNSSGNGNGLTPSLSGFGGSTGSGGSHSGSNHALDKTTISSSGSHISGDGTAGSHSHNLGNIVLSQIDRTNSVLIKSDVEKDTFPAKTQILSTGNMSSLGLSQGRSTNKPLFGSTSNTELDNAGYIQLTSAGSHTHLGNYFSYGDGYWYNPNNGTYYYEYADKGNHSQNLTLNSGEMTLELKRVLLSLWTNASQSFEMASGMIAMWESLTPPDGWLLCNGSNGTPDLRDCFIYPVTTGSENTTPQGDNKFRVNINRTITHNGSHDHTQNYNTGYWYYDQKYLQTYSWSHNHSISRNNVVDYLPPYYALSFIMKAA